LFSTCTVHASFKCCIFLIVNFICFTIIIPNSPLVNSNKKIYIYIFFFYFRLGSPYVAPSEIVQKIMERLREHESHEVDTSVYSCDLYSPLQQNGRLSVLSPNNRQFLEQQRSRSPDMRNKRMIIGKWENLRQTISHQRFIINRAFFSCRGKIVRFRMRRKFN